MAVPEGRRRVGVAPPVIAALAINGLGAYFVPMPKDAAMPDAPAVPMPVAPTMSSEDFRRWREAMGLSQGEAAALLDVSRSCIQQYEMGRRKGGSEPIEIPRAVRLACWALLNGVRDYTGPEPLRAEG